MKQFLFLLALLSLPLMGQVIIVHGDITSLHEETLKKIYLGRQMNWNNGTHITLTMLADGTTTDSFMKEYLRKRKSQFLLYWKQRLFTGRGVMPLQFATDEELIAYIEKTEGAIGFISEDSVRMLPENVSIISISTGGKQ